MRREHIVNQIREIVHRVAPTALAMLEPALKIHSLSRLAEKSGLDKEMSEGQTEESSSAIRTYSFVLSLLILSSLAICLLERPSFFN